MHIRDNDVVWQSEENSIQGVMLDYFRNIFLSNGVEDTGFENHLSVKVSDDNNDLLMAPISSYEVRTSVFSMHPNKLPGPDGLNPTFFQQFWSVVGPDVVQ